MSGKSPSSISSGRNIWPGDTDEQWEAPTYPAPWVATSRSNTLVKRNVELFEKKNQLRIVMTGHGHRIAGEPQITLPLGMTLHFYVVDGKPLENELGRAIEGFTGSGQLPMPVETVKSGAPVWNYRLTWW